MKELSIKELLERATAYAGFVSKMKESLSGPELDLLEEITKKALCFDVLNTDTDTRGKNTEVQFLGVSYIDELVYGRPGAITGEELTTLLIEEFKAIRDKEEDNF